MLSLRAVDYLTISKYFVDFQKKSHSFEMPPEDAVCLGIYSDSVLIGYFILVEYEDGLLEINQGYLIPGARHRRLSYEAMKLLEALAKKAGHEKIVLKATRSIKAYTKFMRNLGFTPESVIFTKVI